MQDNLTFRRFARRLVNLASALDRQGERLADKFLLWLANFRNFEVIPKNQYRCIPKDNWVAGPADHFLLVPKNRYQLTLLPGAEVSADLGVGWITESNTPEQYDRLWGDDAMLDAFMNEGHGVRELMPKEIVEFTADAISRANSVIDIGCGVGDLLDAVHAKNPQVHLAGCDFSAAAIAKARKKFPEADLRVVTIEKSLPFDTAVFDVVLCTDVLEHLLHPREIASELVRICRPGGTVVIVVPDGDVDQFFGHLWFFNERRLSELLSSWQPQVRKLKQCQEYIAIIQVRDELIRQLPLLQA